MSKITVNELSRLLGAAQDAIEDVQMMWMRREITIVEAVNRQRLLQKEVDEIRGQIVALLSVDEEIEQDTWEDYNSPPPDEMDE